MKEFIKGIFSSAPESPSSKRVVMFMFVVAFLIIVFVNLFRGKALSSVLSDQIFYLVIYSMAAVFGEQVTNIFKKSEDIKK
jgi:hypothetical protein